MGGIGQAEETKGEGADDGTTVWPRVSDMATEAPIIVEGSSRAARAMESSLRMPTEASDTSDDDGPLGRGGNASV